MSLLYCPGNVPDSTSSVSALLKGLCVYQDVVLHGSVAHTGVRNCGERWELIEPWLPRSGAVLDIGSNFGWFGLQVCQSRPACVVASLEADERSAAVQREVLASHQLHRMVLLTARASAPLMRQFSRVGQHFAGVLCLSVLHWIRDHRAFLTVLGSQADSLFIEHPNPNESGAGDSRVLAEIGQIGPYLQSLFPHRPLRCLGQVRSHRRAGMPRELWLVGPLDEQTARPPLAGSLDLQALVAAGLAWPQRSWWEQQLQSLRADTDNRTLSRRVLLSAQGLAWGDADQPASPFQPLLRRIPESGLAVPLELWRRRARSLVGGMLHRLKLR